jgi:hypothetical protein
MRIEKIWVAFRGEPNSSALLCDSIEHEGKRWIVPKWLDRADIGKSRPVRIICLDGFLRYTSGGPHQADFQLLEPLSRDVYEGRDPLELGGQKAVIEFPPLEIQNPTSRD